MQVSADGGTNYTTLDTYTAPAAAGAKSYDIASYATANTRVRFLSVDQLEASEYWTIDNAQISWNCVPPILFDGGDKIGSSQMTSMTWAVWATGSGTLNTFAHEIYGLQWGTTYEAPVGTNTSQRRDDVRVQRADRSWLLSNNTTVADRRRCRRQPTRAPLPCRKEAATLVTGHLTRGAGAGSRQTDPGRCC